MVPTHPPNEFQLWLSNNQLQSLVPARGGSAARKAEWLARLTHVCLSSNALRDLPKALLEQGRALVELDCAYNHQLQVGWGWGWSGGDDGGRAGELSAGSGLRHGGQARPKSRLPIRGSPGNAQI